MSSSESEETRKKYHFNGRFGAAPSSPQMIEEPSHAEVDRLVWSILGLDPSREPRLNRDKKPWDEPKS